VKKCLFLLALLFAASAFGLPTCGTGQVNVASLANCSLGDVNFTNWSFSAPGYTGNATVQILVPMPGNYGVDPEVITLRFSDPLLGNENFSLSYTATLTSAYMFNDFAQQLFAGKVPNDATATGVYNGETLITDGLASGDLFAQGNSPLASTVNVALTGTGAHPAPPPPCNPPGLCGGGPVQKVEMNLYQTAVPEPVTMGLVGSGLLVFALTRKRRV
jgi:hypothetical protein